MSGLIHNDLKLDNILLDFKDKLPHFDPMTNDNLFEDVNINLIDFGFATMWLDRESGKHMPENKLH